MHREMKYADIPVGGEWRYPGPHDEGIYLKQPDGRSMNGIGTLFYVPSDEYVILIGLTRKEKIS